MRSALALAALASVCVPLNPALAEKAKASASSAQLNGKVRLGVYDPQGAFGDASDVAIEHIFMPWQEIDWATLRAADQYAASRGRELLISIEPWSWSGDNGMTKEVLAASIAGGEFDQEIDAFCQAAGSLTSKVTIRWGHEMDDTADRYAWSGLQPASYVKAYRHFVDQCRTSAPQALFMWSPKGEPNAAEYYPGDAYVDSVGISIFGLQPYDLKEFGRERTFTEVVRERYDRVAGFGKPIVAAEFGFSGGSDYLGDWAAETKCAGSEFPLLDAVVYFNDVETYPWPGQYGNPDWRVRPELFERSCDEQKLVDPMITGSLLLPSVTATALAPAPSGGEMSLAATEPAAPAIEAPLSYPEVRDEDSVPMLAWELAKLYGGKSWVWSEGAGYLAADRRFVAWSGSGETATYAEGRWSVTDSGRMCFKAVWHSSTGAARNSTCFSHRRIGSTILQKKEPDGRWYVFRSSEPNAQDEHAKLQTGDLVSAKLEEARQQLQQLAFQPPAPEGN